MVDKLTIKMYICANEMFMVDIREPKELRVIFATEVFCNPNVNTPEDVCRKTEIMGWFAWIVIGGFLLTMFILYVLSNNKKGSRSSTQPTDSKQSAIDTFNEYEQYYKDSVNNANQLYKDGVINQAECNRMIRDAKAEFKNFREANKHSW